MTKGLRCALAAALVVALALLLSQFSGGHDTAYAEERDFPAGSEQESLVKEAIKFIEDNEGTTNPTNADEDLTTMLGTKAADDKNQLREDTDETLGGGWTTTGSIGVGLPAAGDINHDIATAEGFRQVKTLAEVLYHEWVHWRQKRLHNNDALFASNQNWAKCQPNWEEIEAYYKEIKLKLQWKLARQERLAEIPGFGPIYGPPTPEQQAEGERLQREIQQLEEQIEEVVNDYLDSQREVNATLKKSYEDNGNHLKAAFAGKTNQQKRNEVVARLGDVSKIDPKEGQRTIEQKIADKVATYRLLKLLQQLWSSFHMGLINFVVVEHGYSHFLEMAVPAGTLYEPTDITVAHLAPTFMDPWRELGYTVLSPVYEVSAPIGAMANPAYPVRVTLSYNKELAEGQTLHLYRMRGLTDGRSQSSEPLFEVLSGESIDYDAGTISGDSDDPFSLYVVMAQPAVGGIVEMQVDNTASAVDSAAHSSNGSSLRYWIALAGATAAIALTAGGWYARRRLS